MGGYLKQHMNSSLKGRHFDRIVWRLWPSFPKELGKFQAKLQFGSLSCKKKGRFSKESLTTHFYQEIDNY